MPRYSLTHRETPLSPNSAYEAIKAKRSIPIKRLEELFGDAELAQQAEDNETIEHFKIRYFRLEETYNEFNKLHSALIGSLSNSDPDSISLEDSLRARIDDIYFRIQRIYKLLSNEQKPRDNGNQLTQKSNVKLPKVTLPHFDGNYQDWPSFIDLFNTLIHNNASLSNVEKFQYLVTSLSKEPSNLLKSIQVTHDNYDLAYNTLVKNFHNKRKLATVYWESIVKFPAVKNSSPKALRNLVNTFAENVSGLNLLGFPTAEWDFVLLMLMLEKIDWSTRQLFEREYSDCEIPSFKDLNNFLIQETKVLESVSLNKPVIKNKFDGVPVRGYQSSFVAKSVVCEFCSLNHNLVKCDLFHKKSPKDRFLFVKEKRLCLNCLNAGHNVQSCSSKFSCRFCTNKHHSLLHFPKKTEREVSVKSDKLSSEPSAHSSSSDENVVSCTNAIRLPMTVLLSTARVEVRDSKGNFHKVRALLDSGSQANFITEKCASRLGLQKSHSHLRIQCLGQASSVAKGLVSCLVRPCNKENTHLALEAYILPKICAETPQTKIVVDNWTHIEHLQLADESFNKPGSIDLLLGAELFASIIREGRLIGKPNQPTAMSTVFGWILMGKVECQELPVEANSLHVEVNPSLQDLDLNLKKIWEMEQIPSKTISSAEDNYVEQHFAASHCRDSSGRYIVSLPFKPAVDLQFENTRALAIRRFLSLERRFLKNPDLASDYNAFMQDYLDSGHMSPVSPIENDCGEHYYIPHHCVLRPGSLTSKIRVVFDASAKDSNNISLNDKLLVGPKLQTNIFVVLLNFRLHAVALTGDIKQMYRQILVDPQQRNFQRIVYRFSPKEPIQDFILNTVTYGVTSSPYLSLRTTKQLAEDESSSYKAAASILKTDIYIDDFVTGCESLEQALVLKNDIVALCRKGGFVVRKWMSNHSELVDLSLNDSQPISFQMENDFSIKILGLNWKPQNDVFSYQIVVTEQACTKRSVLSDLARIFDPIGFLSPVTFSMKVFIQKLWTLGLSWDESPDEELTEKWFQFKSELSLLASVEIPRHISVNNSRHIAIHGFCDASEAGFSAVVYFRIVSDKEKSPSVKLICSKTKVAPLKRISIPRLELCAAHLLAKLIVSVVEVYSERIVFDQICAWSDSSVALAWIRSSPHRWQTFVSNRVTLIQELVAPNLWCYVNTKDNPADCASRGVQPSELIHSRLWWNGPEWLSRPVSYWPQSHLNKTASSEAEMEERKIALIVDVKENPIISLIDKYSSLPKILRVVAYCQRFIHNCRNKVSKITDGYLVSSELNSALLLLVKFVQQDEFGDDICRLKGSQPVRKSFRKLNPFFDKAGILRVGGRLAESSLDFDAKFPALLPCKGRLTLLIIEKFHKENCHPGPQTLHFLLRQQFWILSAKRAINNVLKSCHQCFRLNPQPLNPPVADLPAFRINQLRAFQRVGVDYGGPFNITLGKARGIKSQKAYLCLFSCLVTRAIHLELVSDLTSDAFLAALRRFIARRGRCTDIHSDCGTNFIGAVKTLSILMQNAVQEEKIKWHFNPPSAPHFGGAWESGIKSAKTHLSRITNNQVYTYEEFYTLLVQVEALLNSRPLYPMSSNPNDLSVLTPGHFLVLEPLTSIPNDDEPTNKLNSLKRWHYIQRCVQDIWQRWHNDYLHHLQQRYLRSNQLDKVDFNELVLIKADNIPPTKWQLGRIVEKHLGKDGVCRVATVKTSTGLLKRPLVKLCPLPEYDNN